MRILSQLSLFCESVKGQRSGDLTWAGGACTSLTHWPNPPYPREVSINVVSSFVSLAQVLLALVSCFHHCLPRPHAAPHSGTFAVLSPCRAPVIPNGSWAGTEHIPGTCWNLLVLGSRPSNTAVFLAGAALCTGEELVTWQIPSLLRCLGFVRKFNKLSASALLWRTLTKQIPGK